MLTKTINYGINYIEDVSMPTHKNKKENSYEDNEKNNFTFVGSLLSWRDFSRMLEEERSDGR
jgi:hypothetical protein